MDRLVRSILIGGGAAIAVGGSLYILQQQQRLAKTKLAVTISPEWNFKTKQYILEASTSFDEAERAKFYEQALDTLVTPNTNLSTKSENWLAGYADLLRSLGLANFIIKPDQALEPLKAAQSIPFGNAALRAEAQSTLYELTNDPKALFYDGNDAVPPILDNTDEIKSWSPLLLQQAQYKLQQKDFQSALRQFLELHQRIDPSEDVLCFKAQAGGFIAQVLWKLGKHDDAASWLKASQMDVKCGTPACKETRQMLDQLIDRAKPRN